MNANCGRGVRVVWCALVLGLIAPGLVRAEVGVAIETSGAAPRVVYVFDGVTEDPTPINTIWRKLTPTLDSSHVTLNPAGEANGDGAPSIVTDAISGVVVAAWSRNSATGFDVVVSRFQNGTWTAVQVVAGSPADELDPQLVLDPDGSIHLVYWVSGATPGVFHAAAPADLSSWSTAMPVSQPGQSACRPSGAFYNGVLRVAYELHDFGYGNSPRQVVLARLDNGAFTPEVVAMTNNPGDVRPQVHSHAGRLWVDWVDSETTGGSGEIAWTRQSASGQWDPIRYESFANREQRNYLIRGTTRLKAIE